MHYLNAESHQVEASIVLPINLEEVVPDGLHEGDVPESGWLVGHTPHQIADEARGLGYRWKQTFAKFKVP